jgi:hypothetical protein
MNAVAKRCAECDKLVLPWQDRENWGEGWVVHAACLREIARAHHAGSHPYHFTCDFVKCANTRK